MANYRVIGTPVERVDGPEMLSRASALWPRCEAAGHAMGKNSKKPDASR